MSAPTTATGGRAMVNMFDGTRNLYSDDAPILVTVRDGNQKEQSAKFHDDPSVFFTGLPLFNNFGDDYAFLAAADGYKDAGFFPVKLAANVDLIIDLMLISKSNSFNFAQAKWSVLGNARRARNLLPGWIGARARRHPAGQHFDRGDATHRRNTKPARQAWQFHFYLRYRFGPRGYELAHGPTRAYQC